MAQQWVGVETIISGGQTGADQAGLFAASELGLKTGGTAPRNFRTEAGSNPSLLRDKFGLQASTAETNDYKDRDTKNILASDGSVAFRLPIAKTGRGTERALNYAYSGSYTECDFYQLSKVYPGKHGKETDGCLMFTDGRKPFVIVCTLSISSRDLVAEKIAQFLREHKIKTLNVCGHCETVVVPAELQVGDEKGSFGEACKDILKRAIKKANSS